MQVDLPALDRPTKAISGTSKAGKKCSSGAVVKKRAVCSHPCATFAGGGEVAEMEFVVVLVIDLRLETGCVIVE